MSQSLGRLLSEKRESRYLSLPEAEIATHIKAEYLRALEEERFEALPGTCYVEIYLSEYARFLDLAPELLLTMYQQRMRWVRWRRMAEHWLRSFWHKGPLGPVLLGELALVLVVSLVWVGIRAVTHKPSADPTPNLAVEKRLTLLYPDDGATLNGSEVAFIGKVPSGAFVSVNGADVSPQKSGYFTYTGILQPGDTTWEVRAWDSTGWEQRLLRTVTRPLPTPLPTLVLPAARDTGAGYRLVLNQLDVTHYPDVVGYFTVFDPQGEPWPGLTLEHVAAVQEEDQAVADFILQTVPVSEPLAIALVVDVSGSMQGEPLAQAQQALLAFLGNLGSEDAVALISFNSQVSRLQNFTTDRQALSDAVNGLRANGDTAFNDAIRFGVEQVAGQPFGRRAVVLLTDGRDTASKGTLDQAIGRAGVLNIPVYVVGLQSLEFDAAPLERVAQETGAVYLLAPEAGALQDLYARLNRQLQGQYEVIYRSPGGGTERRLNLTIKINGAVHQSGKSYRVP